MTGRQPWVVGLGVGAAVVVAAVVVVATAVGVEDAVVTTTAVVVDSAEEVEIEEFYDASGKGHAGLSVDANAATGSFGLGGEGRKVTTRIYRFKGLHVEAEKIYNQMLTSDDRQT